MAALVQKTSEVIILRGGSVYSPAFCATADVLIAGGRVIRIGSSAETPYPDWAETVDVCGCAVVPGFIDQHIHITGGGGLGGPGTASPPIPLSAITRSGFTTVVACNGADNVTRNMFGIVTRASALERFGISAYAYSGGYRAPLSSLTGNVDTDIIACDKIIGAKVAVGEARGGITDSETLVHIASSVRVAGEVAGKAGVTHIHLGDSTDGIRVVTEALATGLLDPGRIVLTHVNRSAEILEAAASLAINGIWLDVTAVQDPALGRFDAVGPAEALEWLTANGVNPDRICLSSDCGASTEHTDANGSVYRELTTPSITLAALKAYAGTADGGIARAIRVVTSNPAACLHIDHAKGNIKPGADADVVVLEEPFEIRHVLAGGRWLVRDGEPCVYDYFEGR